MLARNQPVAQPGTHKMISFLLFFSIVFSISSNGQVPNDLSDLYNSIKAQESNFPLPNTTQTITVGQVNLSDIALGYIEFKFLIPVTSEGRTFDPDPNYDPRDNTSKGKYVPNRKGLISVANILHLNLRFEIINWNRLPSSQLTIMLGSQPGQTVSQGAKEIIFSDVTDIDPSLSIAVRGATTEKGKPIGSLSVKGLQPMHINWQVIGAGAITLPVLPVSLVYAPVVDQQKKNQASTEITKTIANTTTISFKTTNSSTKPIPSYFQNQVDLAKDMKSLGDVLVKIPNPYTQAIGTALQVVSGGMGTADARLTKSFGVTSQHTLTIADTKTLTQTTDAKQGGPGVGDLFSYYYNVKVVWYSNNGQMRLAILGYDGVVHTNAQRLKTAYKNLSGSKIDPELHLDKSSIGELLKLDPLVTSPSAQLLPPRYKKTDDGVIVMAGGGANKFRFSEKIDKSDLETTSQIETRVEDDHAGMLAFLGLGVTETKTLQVQIEQTNSLQQSTSETRSQEYTLYGNLQGTYTCEVFYDVVFDAFAFRDLTGVDNTSKVTGKVSDKKGKPVANTKVTAQINSKTYLTKTNSNGEFEIHIPEVSSGHLIMKAGTAKSQIEFNGSPISNIKMQML